MNDLLFYFLDYSSMVTAAIMCMLPVMKFSRIKIRLLMPVVIIGVIISSAVMGISVKLFNVAPNIPLFIFLIPALIFYFLVFGTNNMKSEISFTAKLNVSQNMVISDYELCSVVGNILDNAVAAAREVKDKPSNILFAAETKPNGDLYIAVSNSYDGTVIEKGGKFISTKAGGHGIGIESVRAIVLKNKGYCKFHYDDKAFYSEIMLRQL